MQYILVVLCKRKTFVIVYIWNVVTGCCREECGCSSPADVHNWVNAGHTLFIIPAVCWWLPGLCFLFTVQASLRLCVWHQCLCLWQECIAEITGQFQETVLSLDTLMQDTYFDAFTQPIINKKVKLLQHSQRFITWFLDEVKGGLFTGVCVWCFR